MSQAAYSCKKGCKLSNGDRLIICNRCNFDNVPSTGPVIACMLKDCANMKLPAISNVINSDEEFTVPMRLKPAMVEILRIHNSSTPIKPQDVEDMDACDVLKHLKAEDETIVRDIIAVLHEVQHGRVSEERWD